jgi:hypothetical protein
LSQHWSNERRTDAKYQHLPLNWKFLSKNRYLPLILQFNGGTIRAAGIHGRSCRPVEG